LEEPQRVTGEPVGFIAIEDNGRIVADAQMGGYFFELLFGEKVTADRVLQRGEPVHLHRAGDMTDRVK
jgi:hypothetical protein